MSESTSKKIQLESLIMGFVIAGILGAGGYFVFKEESKVPLGQKSSTIKRYEEGSLHHVDEKLLKYKKVFDFQTQMKEVLGIAVHPKKGIFVCGDSGINLFSFTGKLISNIFNADSVKFMGWYEDETLIVCKGSELILMDMEGNVKKTISNPEWGVLNACVKMNEYLYIADRSMRLIWMCNLEGEVIRKFGGDDDSENYNFIIPGPYMDLALNGKDQLVASNPGRHQVSVYSKYGERLKTFGFPSFKHTGFCGCCNPVALTVLSSGEIVTTEKGISRVKLLNEKGDLIGVLAPPKDFRANKHAFVIDLVEGHDKKVYLLNHSTKEVFVYQRKESQDVL